MVVSSDSFVADFYCGLDYAAFLIRCCEISQLLLLKYFVDNPRHSCLPKIKKVTFARGDMSECYSDYQDKINLTLVMFCVSNIQIHLTIKD